MPLQSSPSDPRLPVEGVIARSRSRYKGPRGHKDLANLPEPPSLSAKQLQRPRNIAPSSCEPKPQTDEVDGKTSKTQPTVHDITQGHQGFVSNTPISEAFRECGNLGNAMNRMMPQHETQSRALRHYQQSASYRSHDPEAEPLKEASRAKTPSQKAGAAREQCSRNLMAIFDEKQAATTAETSASPRRGLPQRIARDSKEKRSRRSREELKGTISAPITIDSPRNVAKPAFDAPLSAVNSGERRVKVKYDQSVMWLPVTPSTTPLDIVRSAADHLAEPIDLNRTVLLESFKRLGLERPLRRYEHVRDVLNSWDHDTQNALVIEQSPTGGEDDLLDLHSVSSSQPGDTSVYIHYSQRPDRWDKRWVTLRSDGQMLVSKKEGGETANICHISDFDIYLPTARHLAKRIRPPEQLCLAIKSQQKSSMFLSTANFVHFFSTSDKTLASSWYKAVLQWRSWYLVNVMGEGANSERGSPKVSTKSDGQEVPAAESPKSRSQRGLPEPLSRCLDAITASSLVNNITGHAGPFRNLSSGHHLTGYSADDIAFHSRGQFQALQSKNPTKGSNMGAPREHSPSFMQRVQQEEPEPFAATGLLGRTYTQRQKAQQKREQAQNGRQDQPGATPILKPPESLDRTLSKRPKPKPLIDLTPQYREPPQHAKKGRGVILEHLPPGGLVEVANTPGDAVPLPSYSMLPRPTSKGRDELSIGRSKTVRRDHSRGAFSGLRQTSASPGKRESAFTGGLLASSSIGEDGARTGTGTLMG